MPQRVLDVLSGAAYEIVRLIALHVPVDDEDDTERTGRARGRRAGFEPIGDTTPPGKLHTAEPTTDTTIDDRAPTPR